MGPPLAIPMTFPLLGLPRRLLCRTIYFVNLLALIRESTLDVRVSSSLTDGSEGSSQLSPTLHRVAQES